MATTLMRTNNLHKVYGAGENAFYALKGVSMEVHQGESLAIIGQSGSGKSTLLQLLGLLDTPSSGDLTIDGNSVRGMTTKDIDALRNESFGFVFQQFHLDESATLFENVSLPMMIAGTSRSQYRPRVEDVLQRLGMEQRMFDPVGQLSGGQRQRVAIARALINRPRILFADEPTGALDVENSRSVSDLLFELNSMDGITLVIVTHSTELTSRCDRQLRIVDGQLTEQDKFALAVAP